MILANFRSSGALRETHADTSVRQLSQRSAEKALTKEDLSSKSQANLHVVSTARFQQNDLSVRSST